ncbi:Hypothetical predicted protein [Marmota monax]|uniref:Uncharacterized protein n=1 Tax=Marmota monax TaxID=9995 RepID=A0A5E4ASZ2_MARMO|nr:hypothetical protein GHT09_004429 [Marmota monax]VTJ59851.1 Hypothetical predicted protein [Marmota monax]
MSVPKPTKLVLTGLGFPPAGLKIGAEKRKHRKRSCLGAMLDRAYMTNSPYLTSALSWGGSFQKEDPLLAGPVHQGDSHSIEPFPWVTTHARHAGGCRRAPAPPPAVTGP